VVVAAPAASATPERGAGAIGCPGAAAAAVFVVGTVPGDGTAIAGAALKTTVR
jgi:hypothetical protein